MIESAIALALISLMLLLLYEVSSALIFSKAHFEQLRERRYVEQKLLMKAYRCLQEGLEVVLPEPHSTSTILSVRTRDGMCEVESAGIDDFFFSYLETDTLVFIAINAHGTVRGTWIYERI